MRPRTPISSTLLVTLAALTLSASGAHAAPHVLGADAAARVKPWVARLASVTPTTGSQIAFQEVTVQLADADCALRLSHPSAPVCADATKIGGATACWVGEACPDPATRARALAAAGALELPWRATARDDARPANAEPGRDGVDQARSAARKAYHVKDTAGARGLLAPLLARDDVHPPDLVDVLVVLSGAGGGAEALAALRGGAFDRLSLSLRAALHVAAVVGPALGGAALEATWDPEMACAAVGYLQGLAVVHEYELAARLAGVAKGLAPDCFEAYRVEVEGWALLRRAAETRAAADAAARRFPDHADQAWLREQVYLAEDDREALVGLYEARLDAGERSPGLFKALFSLYVRDKEGLLASRLEMHLKKADADPDNRVSALFAGVMLHYRRSFRRSNALVERAAPAFPDEPRVYIYRAMNWFNLGDAARAEGFIAQAEALATKDPDVYYCMGEIYRDTDRPRAMEALEVYWHMTQDSSGTESEKQQRVRGMMDAIAVCIAADTPAPCPGPFEHTFAGAPPEPAAP